MCGLFHGYLFSRGTLLFRVFSAGVAVVLCYAELVCRRLRKGRSLLLSSWYKASWRTSIDACAERWTGEVGLISIRYSAILLSASWEARCVYCCVRKKVISEQRQRASATILAITTTHNQRPAAAAPPAPLPTTLATTTTQQLTSWGPTAEA